MKSVQKRNINELSFHERLHQQLSSFIVKIVRADGTVSDKVILDNYFLVNDVWNVEFIGQIVNFSEDYQTYKYQRKNIYFKFINESINLELKYVLFTKLFNDEWALSGLFKHIAYYLNHLTDFVNEKHSTLRSFLEIDIEKFKKQWIFWLNEKGIKTYVSSSYSYKKTGKEYKVLSPIVGFISTVYQELIRIADNREEWEKDIWDVRNLHQQCGIEYNKSGNHRCLNFTLIENLTFRESLKSYIKQRLLSRKFTWSSACSYVPYLSKFFEFIRSTNPTWNDLKPLERKHIINFIEWLNIYAKNRRQAKNSNVDHFILKSITIVQKFLEDIQCFDYTIAPIKPIKMLIFQEDKPKQQKKSYTENDHIPDYVLDQFFSQIERLHKEVQPIVWVAFKTGLRISDVLGLKQDCLLKLNNKYYIETDIEKTYVKGHRIPIDDELANMIAVLINNSFTNSNDDNNHEKYIFIRYRGSRKGRPYSSGWVRDNLNIFARECNITDEGGKLFHFKTHQFRHTYAVKMLNGGADILTVQELLAHASPEMTMRYAKLLDNTKRKAFEEAIKQGVFSFDLNGEVQEIKPNEDIPTDILETLWQDHKLNAIDNPYGTCHARINGNCPHAEEPPCLTCNGGSPCKDLAIGFSELDTQKYELLVRTTARTIEALEQRGRVDIAEKNKKNLERYENILTTIREGNIIFGRLDRIKRKQGVLHG